MEEESDARHGRTYFVSGIDTDVGKTVVPGLMARHLASRGVDAITVKMVQTGCDGFSEDLDRHRLMCGIPPQGEDAACVEIPELEPNSPVELTGLPDYYNASNIVADAEGKVYLYLKATYDDEKTYFTANGQLYQAVVIDSGGAITAKKVTYVPPDALHIDLIAVATDAVTFVVSAEPDGWLTEATAPFIRVRAAAGLPLPEGDEALLNQEDLKISLNGDGAATMTIPRAANAPQTFYRVEAPR